MNTQMTTLDVNGFVVILSRKTVKNWYLRVVPPHGHIKMTAPKWMSQKAICDIIHLQSEWIIQQQQAISILPPTPVLTQRDRLQLQLLAEPLFIKWQAIIGVKINEWRIKKMTTRWGTCNIEAKRIWLNLALVKKPVECLEYIVVHELVHLLERNHNRKFHAHMDRFLPQWRQIKNILDT